MFNHLDVLKNIRIKVKMTLRSISLRQLASPHHLGGGFSYKPNLGINYYTQTNRHQTHSNNIYRESLN